MNSSDTHTISDDFDPDEDRLREECGVFGVFGHPDASAFTALGLHALQHRGQEAAGIVSFDGQRFQSERRLGLVGDHFSKRSVIERLAGEVAIGHVRYSTTGETILRNVQPLFADLHGGGFAVCHNGNLTNALTPAPRAHPPRRDLPVDVGHRGDPPSRRPLREDEAHRQVPRRAPADRGRVFAGRHDQQEADRRPRPARHPSARPRRPRRHADPRLRELRARHHRREVRARRRERRGRGDLEGRHRELQAVRAAGAAALHLRVHLFRAARLGRRRQERLRGAQASRPRARARDAGRCRRRRAGARFGRAGGDRLLPGIRHSLRARHHPQPLCRPDLHRADAADPGAGRAPQAQRQPLAGRGQARDPARRQPRARHHLREDRAA